MGRELRNRRHRKALVQRDEWIKETVAAGLSIKARWLHKAQEMMKPCKFCGLINARPASVCIVCGATLVETPAIESLPEGKTESADSTFWLRSGRPENAATPLDAVRSQRTTHGYRLLKKALAEKFDLPDFPPAETQSFYQNFAPGEAATRTVVYLNAAAGEHTRSAVQSGEIYLVGSDGNKSAYVLFTGTSGQGWVSPNPQRSSLEATSQGVSERARELLARGRADIQMVLVERISDDHQAAATKALMPLAGDPVVHQTAPSCGRTGIRHYWKGHHLTLIIQLRL